MEINNLNKHAFLKRIVNIICITIILICINLVFNICDSYAASIVDSGTLDNGNVSWTLDSNGTLTISGTGTIVANSGNSSAWSDSSANYTNKTIKNVTIENGITAIGRCGFSRCVNLKNVTIPSTVTKIDTYAFQGCSSLEEIVIPNSVTSFGQYVFQTCRNLSNVKLSNNMSSIPYRMFEYCDSLKSITIPASVKEINSYAFFLCSNLSEIIIPNGVTKINDSAFEQCNSLQSIEIPDTVTTIGKNAFYSCSALTEIEIGDSIESIGDDAFAYCENLTSITIPNCKMGTGVFSNCTGIRTVIIPSDVSEIAASTFSNCTSITEIIIPESVGVIGASAFLNCTSLQNIQIAGTPSVREYVFKGCTGLTSITLPVNIVGAGVFSNCTGLQNVTIPEGTKNIGYMTFYNCTSIQEIVLPIGIEEIEDLAFQGCTQLNSIIIPNTVNTIGDNSFVGLNDLIIICDDNSYAYSYVLSKGIKYDLSTGHQIESYTIIKDATCIEEGIKRGTCSTCNREITLQIPANGHSFADEFTVDKEPTCTEDGSKSKHCANCEEVTDVTTIPANGHEFATEFTVDKEPTYTEEGSKSRHCANCDEVTDVTVIPMLERTSIDGANVSEIEDQIYTGTYIWPEVIVSLNGETLERNVDYEVWCSNNTDVGEATATIKGINKYEGSVTCYFQIVPYAGADGANVTWHLSDDGTLTFSGTGAIADYTNGSPHFTPWRDKYNIKRVVFEDGITRIGDWLLYRLQGLEEVVIPDSVVSIGEGSFYLSSSLTSIDLPDSVTTIGARAFDHTGIESFTVPPKVTEIPDQLFYYGKLKSIKLHSGVTSIGNYAFYRCPLQSITLPESISSIADNAFYSCSSLDTVYVVENSYADNWVGNTYNKVYVYRLKNHYIYNEVITKEATCLEKGEIAKDCSICGERIIEEIPANGHSFSEEFTVDTEPTCTADGSKSKHCANCDEVTDITVIPANGHSFGPWEEITASTCTNSGVQQHVCGICGFTETKELDPKGHDWEDNLSVDVEPTCIEDGSKSRHCKNCDAVIDSEVIPATGHSGEWKVVIEPTCTAVGSKERLCAVCGNKSTEEIPEKGHSWNSEPTVDKAATCTAAGSQSVHCARCSETKDAETIPALGHNWASTDTVDKAPTCTKDGQESTHCSRCDVVKEGSVKAIPATGHKFSAWETTKKPTELASGQQSRTCSACDKNETKTIAQLAPTLPAVKITKPKAAKKSATIKWKKVSKANQKKIAKIQIQYSLDKTFKTGIKTVTTKKTATSKKITKLTSRKTYYVRIRAYKKDAKGVHVSKWSATKAVKAK